jgi:hypothetical protein
MKSKLLYSMLIIALELSCSVGIILTWARDIANCWLVIEGDGKAVLYTGDIRSELWFVNNLMRSPFLIEYTSGLKQLDCLYLDTSHTQPVEFPSKAEGLQELLQKVSQYPPETVFHFSAWTFGYEEVWMALSKKLESAVCLFPVLVLNHSAHSLSF